MAVIIKAYLYLPGIEKPEIRRLSINLDRCATFANLNRKLEKAFPCLDDLQSRVEFQLYWKDSEGDEIALSTNAELSEALDNITDNVLKIYIKVKPTQPSNCNDNGENVFHPNVTCDGCQGAIYGIRYKCMVCFDYDLCNTCESKGIHNEHPFARIKSPGKFPPFAPPPPPPPFHFGMFGRHGGGKWFGKWHGNCHQGGRWNHHQHKHEFGAAPEAHFEQPTTETKNQPDFQDFLKNVGETVKAYLDPLGIDVQVDVEHGKDRHCAGCGSARNDPTNSHQSCPSTSTSAPTTTSTFTATTTSTSTATSVPVAAASPPSATTASAASTNLINATKTSPPEGSNQDSPDNASPGNSTEDMDCDWTYVIHKEAEPDGNGAKKVIFELKQSKTGSGNEIISDADKAAEVLAATNIQEKTERPIRHSNPTINDALYIMEEMGFNDDGGWLTVLLEAKNGNIAKVLDALQPSK